MEDIPTSKVLFFFRIKTKERRFFFSGESAYVRTARLLIRMKV